MTATAEQIRRFETALDLPPITLSELQHEAAFLTRMDRKYIVREDVAAALIESVEAGTRALEIDGLRTFRYSTRYFDDDHVAYFRSLRKRRDRFKVRTRRYDDSDLCLTEVKLTDGRGRTIKLQQPHDPEQLDTLSAQDRQWLQSFDALHGVADRLERSIETRYQRTTLVFPDGSGRMTIDQNLAFAHRNGDCTRFDRYCVVETKGPGNTLPFDRQLWAVGVRPVAASKFALGVCLLHPHLPDNRWHRLRGFLERSVLQPCNRCL